MFLMQLCQYIHDGHRPWIQRSEDHAAEAGLQDFGNKWYHIQQLLLSFDIRLKKQGFQLQILKEKWSNITSPILGCNDSSIRPTLCSHTRTTENSQIPLFCLHSLQVLGLILVGNQLYCISYYFI